MKVPPCLVYKNRGVLAVIPDYRLAMICAMLLATSSQIHVFLTGHSAGGTLHLFLFLSKSPRFLEPSEVKQHIKGIAPRDPGCASDLVPLHLASVSHLFCGGQEKKAVLSPLGQLGAVSWNALPSILLMRMGRHMSLSR